MGKLLNTKLFALAVLALVLVFAINQVEWKVQERRTTRDGAVAAIAEQYAREQRLTGPMLWLECRKPGIERETDNKGVTYEKAVVHDCSRLVRPTRLASQGRLDVGERYRGIYKARVFLTSLKLTASLPRTEITHDQTITAAALVFGVSDPRGLKRIQLRDGAGRPLDAHPGVPSGSPLEHGFHVPLAPDRLDRPLDITAELEIAGSGRFDWVPVAGENDFILASTWPHPGFSGQFLPETREIGANGFTARWRVNDFATGGDGLLAKLDATTLGVSLIDPVDTYTQTDRAVRYGFLFVLLTLGGFFLFEILKRRPVHPLQYLLIGFAVVLFFLLLLALSEHLVFGLAYLVAAAACVLLITTYGRTLVGGWAGASVLGAGYTLLYLGLYQLLASEDYALLMGTWLIFGLLALTMWLTRRLDWGRAGERGTE